MTEGAGENSGEVVSPPEIQLSHTAAVSVSAAAAGGVFFFLFCCPVDLVSPAPARKV